VTTSSMAAHTAAAPAGIRTTSWTVARVTTRSSGPRATTR
jgi:hypothetical protein